MEDTIEKPANTGGKVERNENGQLMPGSRLNPAGKPKGAKHFSTIFNEILKEKVELKDANGNIVKMELGRAIGRAIARKALKGDVHAFDSIADRMDGKPAQSIEMEVTTPPIPIYNGKSIRKPNKEV